MSIHAETTITIYNVSEEELDEIIKKLKEDFYQKIEYREHDIFTMYGRIWESDDVKRNNQILKLIWCIIGRYVRVDIEYRWIEQAPIDEYRFDESKYYELM